MSSTGHKDVNIVILSVPSLVRSRVLVRTVGDLNTYVNFINDVISKNIINFSEKVIIISLSKLIKVSVVRIKEWKKIYEKINNNLHNPIINQFVNSPDTPLGEFLAVLKQLDKSSEQVKTIVSLASPSSSPFSTSSSDFSLSSLSSSSSSSSSSISSIASNYKMFDIDETLELDLGLFFV